MLFPDENQVQIDGTVIRYLKAGAGSPLVLLHAGGESARDWEWIIPALAGKYRIIAPDLHYCCNGNGNSNGSSARHMADLVSKFLRALGVEEAVVVGNSLGGLIALHIALAGLFRATGLVLVSSAGLGREITPLMLGMTMPVISDLTVMWGTTPIGAMQRAIVKAPVLFSRLQRIPCRWFMDQYRLAQLPNFLTATLNSMRAQIDPGGQREVLLDELRQIELPTLVVWGADDRVIPVEHARRAMERLPHGTLEIIPDCGHLPQIEQWTLFTAKLMRFLDTLSA